MRLRFSGSEWEQLLRVPAVLFWAVAMADGRADSGEERCFLDYVNRADHADPLLAMVCDVLSSRGAEALQLSDRERDFRTYLGEMRGLLGRVLSPQESRSFLAGLLCLGHHVADASGGFFGLGNRISGAEAARLVEVSSLLGLPALLDQD